MKTADELNAALEATEADTLKKIAKDQQRARGGGHFIARETEMIQVPAGDVTLIMRRSFAKGGMSGKPLLQVPDGEYGS